MRNWKKASENRTLSRSTDTHVSSMAQASGRNTVVLDKFDPTPLLRWNGHKVWQKKGQREVLLCTNTLGPTSDDSIWSFWTLVKAKRPRLIGKRLEPTTIAH